MHSINVGLIGCGNISGQYIKGCRMFPILQVAACADLNMSVAQAKAAEYGIPKVVSVDDLLADPDIQIVVNLTIPKAHMEVCLAAIRAGKHVHVEKPLALHRADGQKILAAAKNKGVRVGAAPDTFLGGGLQTCRKLIDDGAIGTPIGAMAAMTGHGHESWHPNPAFYYEAGGGPMLDMGPYYVTALVSLLGAVKRVTGSTRASFPERTITSQPRYGEKVKVEVPTHYAGVMDFANGAIGTIVTSFDVWGQNANRVEIYGTEGTLIVPDPNTFGGVVSLYRADEKQWRDIPLTHESNVLRGIGVADMAYGLMSGRPHRASGELAYHVLDVMQAFEEASTSGQHVTIGSTVSQPAPLPMGLATGTLDS